jgi:hypothetical protein
VLLGPVGEDHGPLKGFVDGALAAEAVLDGAPVVGRNFAVGDDLADHVRHVRSGSLQEQDHRQRDLAFTQVATERLAQHRFIRHKIEHVVHDLERDTEVESVLAQGGALFRVGDAQGRPDFGAAGEQERRLPADDLEVLVFGDVGITGLGQLEQLPFDHAQRDVTEQADDFERVLGERHGHRSNVEVVAQKDGDVAAPPRVGRQPAPAGLGPVDDVVVNQGRRVDELHHGGVQNGPVTGVPTKPRRHEQDGRPHALAAAHLHVLAHLRDEVDARFEMAGKLALDAREFIAYRLKDLRQARHGCGSGIRENRSGLHAHE